MNDSERPSEGDRVYLKGFPFIGMTIVGRDEDGMKVAWFGSADDGRDPYMPYTASFHVASLVKIKED